MSDIQKATEALQETRSLVEGKVGTLEEKVNKFSGEEKQKWEDANAALDKLEEANQKLTIEQQKTANYEQEKKEFVERLENAEKIILDSNKKSEIVDFKESEEYKAFNSIVKKEFKADRFTDLEKKYLRTDVGDQGGFLVPEILDTELLKEIVEITPVLSLVRTRNFQGVKTLNIPVRTGIPLSSWVGEKESKTDSQSSYGLCKLTAHALCVKTTTTRDLLNFAQFDISSEIGVDAVEEFSRAIGQAIIEGTGSGTNQPEGILTNSDIQRVDTINSGSLVFDDVISIVGEIKIGYNPVYGFNRKTLVVLRQEKDSNGNYLWRIGGESMPSTIVDFSYIVMQDMPDITTGLTPVVFGDFFRGYTILD